MKKLMKAMTLLLVALMLFASCTPDTPAPTPDDVTPDVPAPLPAPKTSFDTSPTKLEAHTADAPYDSLHYGLFDNQEYTSYSTPKGGQNAHTVTKGRYSLFIPKEGKPKLPAVIVFTPDNTTAAEFARTDIGVAWMEEANKKGFAVCFAEPEDGKTWNLSGNEKKRDEAAFGLDLYTSLRLKKITDNAFINVDKNTIALVGYKEGGSMAALVAAAWPQVYPNFVAIEPLRFKDCEDSIKGMLELPTYPHSSEYGPGTHYGNVIAGEIGMPAYVLPAENEKIQVMAGYDYAKKEIIYKDVDYNSGKEILKVWEKVNENPLKEDTSTAESFLKAFDLTGKPTAPADVAKLSLANGRFRGYRGGTIRALSDFTDKTHFHIYNEKLPGSDLIRRWMVYTPDGLPEEEKVPMVVVLHGASAAMTDICDESKWTDVADDQKIVVAFLQAMTGDSGTATPGWASSGGDETDIDAKYVADVTKKITAEYNVDPSRVYLTGHSNGSMMVHAMIKSEYNNLYAAFGPIGMTYDTKGVKHNDIIALWPMNGDLDMQVPSGPNGAYACGKAWAARYGIKADPVITESGEVVTDKYETHTWSTAAGVPLVKVSGVNDSPHVYMAEQSEMLWDWFKDFSRTQDEAKTLNYKGTPVETTIKNYEPPKKPAGK